MVAGFFDGSRQAIYCSKISDVTTSSLKEYGQHFKTSYVSIIFDGASLNNDNICKITITSYHTTRVCSIMEILKNNLTGVYYTAVDVPTCH